MFYLKKKKKPKQFGRENTDEATNLHFDCAKHRTIKRYIYIQQTILCKHGKYVSFQKTWSYHKYRQHWHRQTLRNEHSGLLRCSPRKKTHRNHRNLGSKITKTKHPKSDQNHLLVFLMAYLVTSVGKEQNKMCFTSRENNVLLNNKPILR